ncbi:isopenicillin N synthase family dioxygenase [Pseudonocardia benzenivorans]|uniref:Isopenicillin N synthase family dioxygenase n=1 Tax=Pseudonocardia benzenivorans TaxID=228005 RepID=A0ABW3VJT6_9PSEU
MTAHPPGTTEDPTVVGGFVPVVDVGGRDGSPARRREIARAIDTACRESGFFGIVGHGVDLSLIQRMHDVTVDLFSTPDEDKAALLVPPDDPTLRGIFARAGSVSAAEDITTSPDLCELFTMNQLGEPGVAEVAGLGDAYDVWSRPNVWPERPAGFKETWLEYYRQVSDLSADLMRLCALGLGLDEEFFTPFVDIHSSNLTANWYPPVDTDPLPDQYRKGPHSDWGTLTILYQDNCGGLQVFDKAGDWIDVPVVEGGFVVNIGDLMAVWTNDEWVSTKHRVLAPTGEMARKPRVSLAFFHQPNWSADIECLPSCQGPGKPAKYAPTTSGAYLLQKMESAFGSAE